MARFKKNGKKELPEINNSSMSDIIFMFLFFFMVITTMRESDAAVKFTAPHATEYQKLEKKSSIATIYMEMQNFQTASIYLKQATERDPFFSEAWLKLAECYDYMGYSDDAEMLYQRSLGMNEENEITDGCG